MPPTTAVTAATGRVPAPGLPSGPAMARLGARLAADLPSATLHALRRLAAGLRGLDPDALAARIAADFRADRTVTLRGIALSRSEAACFIAAHDREDRPGGWA